MTQQKSALPMMRCTDKATGERIWAVRSSSQSLMKNREVFHLVRWDAQAVRWVCQCPARKPCIHIRQAAQASRDEHNERQQEADRIAAEVLTGRDVYDEMVISQPPQGVRFTR